MKKTVLLTTLALIALSVPFAAAQTDTSTEKGSVTVDEKMIPEKGDFRRPDAPPPKFDQNFEKKKQDFEKQLKLTDEQKEKAKVIREKGHKEMKAVFEKIKAKREEIAKIEQSKLTNEAKREKIEPLHKELQDLVKLSHKIKIENMKEFEGILTAKQQKKLEKIKTKKRKEFEKNMKKGKNGKQGEFKRPPMPHDGMPPREFDKGFKGPDGFHPDIKGGPKVPNRPDFTPPPPPKEDFSKELEL